MLEVNDNWRSPPIVLNDHTFGESMTFSDLYRCSPSHSPGAQDALTHRLYGHGGRAVGGEDQVRDLLGEPDYWKPTIESH